MGKRNCSFLTSDKIFGLTAMLISLVTLVIFVRQTNIMDKQSRLSALPYLMVEQSTNSTQHRIQFSLVNHGVGPAIIESRKIVYQGKEYDQDFYQFITQNLPALDTIEPFNWSNVYTGQAIPNGGRIVMAALGNDSISYGIAVKTFQNLLALKDEGDFYFEIIYTSIYGDRWRLSTNLKIPENT